MPQSCPSVLRLTLTIFLLAFSGATRVQFVNGDELHLGFDQAMKPLLHQYCADCHHGDDANGEVAFDRLGESSEDVVNAFEIWESVAEHLRNRTMPPDDSQQPNDHDRQEALDWYEDFVDSIEPRPAVLRPRRLSVIEFRNTLHSLLGFELETAVIEAEQTEAEKSLVVKLLPTDPPGANGFTNDTHANPLTTVAWDQYNYLIDTALEALFSPERRESLQRYTGPIEDQSQLESEHAANLIQRFVPKALRRPPSEAQLAKIESGIIGLAGDQLIQALKLELKAVLVSPAFLYRGFLVEGPRGVIANVDDYELAERLSYFLWADMPDEELLSYAQKGNLSNVKIMEKQVDRMLGSPKVRSLSEIFVTQWFSLSEIDLASDNPPIREAWKSQPLDFMHFLFTSDRPLIEMVDSQVSFINAHTSRLYGKDAKQLGKYVRQKGIEIEKLPNQQIEIRTASERGGVLTMPGILAMNRGPILRGTWILERILGDELSDPPANVGQVANNKQGENLTFRQRFERHRADNACAVCHDKIDPLGFSLQRFDDTGQYYLADNYRAKGKGRKNMNPSTIDPSGQLPTGEKFADSSELKQLLVTNRREDVVRNIVERTLAYALCRKLELYDRPAIEKIETQMLESNGTWRDLFHAITQSLPFRQTILSER